MTDKYGHIKIKCNCKDCGIEMYRRTDIIKDWKGRCAPCAKIYRKSNAKGRVKKRILVKCRDCGVEWEKRDDGLKKWKGFCKDCSHKYKHSTPEQKERCRKHMIAVREKYNGVLGNVVYKKGNEHQNWKGGIPKCLDCGKQLSAYYSKRCPECHYKTKTGENHHNWKGGEPCENHQARRTAYCKRWRRAVLKRDNKTCIICQYKSVKAGDIIADHIKPFYLFKELRFDVSNGRTLCLNCNHVYGYNHKRDRAKIVKMNFEIDKTIAWGKVSVQ